MELWQANTLVAIGTAVGVGVLTWLARRLLASVRGDGTIALRKIEIAAQEAFRDDLMQRLEKTELDLERAWERVRQEERRATELAIELARTRTRLEALEQRISGLEAELESERAARR